MEEFVNFEPRRFLLGHFILSIPPKLPQWALDDHGVLGLQGHMIAVICDADPSPSIPTGMHQASGRPFLRVGCLQRSKPDPPGQPNLRPPIR